MVVLSPIWLVALAPLAALTIWLLLGRRPKVNVSFLPLWQGPDAKRRRRRSFEPPPLAILLVLLSLTAAILAAARIQVGSVRRAQVRLIIDRGLSMSARGRRDVRFREAAEEFESALQTLYKDAAVELAIVPGPEP